MAKPTTTLWQSINLSYPAVQLQYSTKYYYELLQEQLKRLAAKEEIL